MIHGDSQNLLRASQRDRTGIGGAQRDGPAAVAAEGPTGMNPLRAAMQRNDVLLIQVNGCRGR